LPSNGDCLGTGVVRTHGDHSAAAKNDIRHPSGVVDGLGRRYVCGPGARWNYFLRVVFAAHKCSPTYNVNLDQSY
jgi:hypothetical protein